MFIGIGFIPFILIMGILMISTVGWTNTYSNPTIDKENKDKEMIRQAVRQANGWRTADELYQAKLEAIRKGNESLNNQKTKKLSLEEWFIKNRKEIILIVYGDKDKGINPKSFIPNKFFADCEDISAIQDYFMSLSCVENVEILQDVIKLIFAET